VANPYDDTTEAVELLITDRATRYADDFIGAREESAVLLRDAVMKSAATAGYFAKAVDGHYVIAPRETSTATVVILASSEGIHVAKRENGKLTDEAVADVHYDAFQRAWVAKPPAAHKGGPETKDSKPAEPVAPRSPVAIVAELVVAALQKIP
jgi:hypothetical protein